MNTRGVMIVLQKLITIVALFALTFSHACIPSESHDVEETVEETVAVPEPQNQQPVISSIIAPDKALISSTIEISCIAHDPDGDELVYQWSSERGVIKGQGANITWVAPELPGIYPVHIEVNDNKGGSVASSITIHVTDIPNRAPKIIKFIIPLPKPVGTIEIFPPPELSMQPGVRAKVYTPVPITCVAEDPDSDVLTYMWTVTEGKIRDAEKNRIVWIAPTNPVRQYIMVTVNDNQGGSATASLAIEIDCCK